MLKTLQNLKRIGSFRPLLSNGRLNNYEIIISTDGRRDLTTNQKTNSEHDEEANFGYERVKYDEKQTKGIRN